MPALKLGTRQALDVSSDDCPFCALFRAAGMDSRDAVAIPDGFPLNPGHHLVIPRRHVADFFELTETETAAVMRLVRATHDDIAALHRPDGFNVGVNAGYAGGQTIGHVHVHVIPRYTGDVEDPRGGVRRIVPARAEYWNDGDGEEAATCRQ